MKKSVYFTAENAPIIACIVGIIACIVGIIALPQIQKLIDPPKLIVYRTISNPYDGDIKLRYEASTESKSTVIVALKPRAKVECDEQIHTGEMHSDPVYGRSNEWLRCTDVEGHNGFIWRPLLVSVK